MIYIQKTGEPEEVSRWKKKFKNKHKREAGYEDIRHEKELQILKNALLAEQRHLSAIVVLILKIQRLKYKRIVFMWNIFDLRHKIRIYLWPIIIFMLLVMETIAGTVGIKKKIILMQSG